MSNLLGPRDANGIPVPMTVDESIASMKASLLKKSNVLPTFIAWTAAAVTVAKSKFSPRFRRCSMQNASALKLFRHRVMRIFYCLPARSPVQCDPLRCVRGSPRRTRKSVSPTVPAVTAAGSSTISTACGAVRIKSSRWMSTFRGARQRLPPRCTALRWRSACWSRKFTPVGRVSRMNNRRRFCMAIW